MGHGYETSLVKRVVDQLSGGIVNGDYVDNALPPQLVLSKKYGVSLTVLREALSILASRRMLDVRQKTGMRVKPAGDWVVFDHEVAEWRLNAIHDPDYLQSLYELRAFVDPRAAFLAAKQASRNHRIEIAGAHQNLLSATAQPAARDDAEDALRTAIIEASGDELLRQMGKVIRTALRACAAARVTQTGDREARARLYGKVVVSIERRDADSAKDAMTLLVNESAARLAL
jgi:DNA-binding FadR family transcriptional regulator